MSIKNRSRNRGFIAKAGASVVTAGLFATAIVVPSAFAAAEEDNGPWGTYKEKNPNIISIFYDHVGKDASVPQGKGGIEKSQKWFMDEIKKYNPNAFDGHKPIDNACLSFKDKDLPKTYYDMLIVFPANTVYKTPKERDEAILGELKKFKDEGFPGIYGEYSRNRVERRYDIAYAPLAKGDGKMRSSVCMTPGDPDYTIDKTTTITPNKNTITDGRSDTMNADIDIVLDNDGNYLSEYDEKLDGVVTLTYDGEDSTVKPKTVSKKVTFNKSDKKVKTPDFIPSDFGLTSWVPGTFKYDLSVPNQGLLGSNYKSDPSKAIVTVIKGEIVTPNIPEREGNKVTISKLTGVNYSANLTPVKFNEDGKATIELVPNEETTITATPEDGYKFDGDQSKDWKLVGEKNIVTPVEPVKDNNKVTVKETPGVEYTVDDKKVEFKDGEKVFTIESGKTITVNAKPDDKHKFEGEQSKDWKFDWVAPVDTKQSDKPKPTPKPVKTPESDLNQSKPATAPRSKVVDTKQSRTVDTKQSHPANSKQSGEVKKAVKLSNTGAVGVTAAVGTAIISVLIGAAGVVIRRRM